MTWLGLVRRCYALRTLVALVALFALWAGYHATRGWKERRAEGILGASGHASYSYRQSTKQQNQVHKITLAYDRLVQAFGLERHITSAAVLTPLDAEDASALRELPHLDSLSLKARWPSAGVPRVKPAVSALELAIGTSNIKDLSLDGFDLSDADCVAISHQRSIKELYVSDASFTLRGLGILLSTKELRSLNLLNCQITITEVAGVPPSSRLEQIGIGNTPLGDGAARLVAACDDLRSLAATGRSIDDRFLESLGGHPSLISLSVPGRTVTQVSVNAIKRMPSLRKLQLSGDHIPQPSVEHIRESRPDLEIVILP